ncbi:MAG: hypothetical protein NUV46_00825 [Nanoarchaeota archaeon]|nr:hypothetical protein [Nanoarchaeota archaeon]
MSRVRFKKGEQRKFIVHVLEKLNCPSLRALNQFGFEVPYSTLKNYFSEARTLPEELFKSLCYLSKVSPYEPEIERLKDHWGQIIGGVKKKVGRKKN